MEANGILLVEDNEDDIILIKRALEDAGLHNPVHTVTTADEAIAYLSGSGQYEDRVSFPLPKVVFVDVRLPGKSGHEVLRAMAATEELRDVVRVVLTGSEDPSDRRIALELGAHCYLEKPITKEQLIGPSRNLRMTLAQR